MTTLAFVKLLGPPLTEEVREDLHLVLPGGEVIERVVVGVQTPLVHPQVDEELELAGVPLQRAHVQGGLAHGELDLATWKQRYQCNANHMGSWYILL
jgi:hypothetical protein